MKFILLFLLIISLSLKVGGITQTKENPIKIHFSNVRNTKGTLSLGFFRTQAEFDKEKPFKKIFIPKTGLRNKELSAIINLPNGTYGISVLDDENDNSKMDYNLIQIPTEGFGFSNYYHAGYSKPKLSLFLITVHNGTLTIDFKLRYI